MKSDPTGQSAQSCMTDPTAEANSRSRLWGVWPTGCKSEVSKTSSSVLSNLLLEQLTEIWRLVYSLDYQFTTKESLYKGSFSCVTLCDPLYYSLPGSSVHGILQARLLGWVAISYFRGSSRPRDLTHVSCVSCISYIAGRFFITEPPGKRYQGN